jgi:hypothetical protein
MHSIPERIREHSMDVESRLEGRETSLTGTSSDSTTGQSHSSILKELVENRWGSTLEYVVQTHKRTLRSRVQTTLPDRSAYAGPWSYWRRIKPSPDTARRACEEQAAERALPQLFTVDAQTQVVSQN